MPVKVDSLEGMRGLISDVEREILISLRKIEEACDGAVTVDEVRVEIQPAALGLPSTVVGVEVETKLAKRK